MPAVMRILAQVVVDIPPIPPIPPIPDISQFPQTPVPPSDIPPEVVAWLQGIPPELIIVPIIGVLLIGGSIVFLLTRAIARRIEGKGTKEIQAEITALHERIAELESGHQRIAELEERIDFSERMLVRARPSEVGHPGAER